MKHFILWMSTFLLFIMSAGAAFYERGERLAFGGEWLIFLLPILFYVIEASCKSFKDEEDSEKPT